MILNFHNDYLIVLQYEQILITNTVFNHNQLFLRFFLYIEIYFSNLQLMNSKILSIKTIFKQTDLFLFHQSLCEFKDFIDFFHNFLQEIIFYSH